MALTLATLDRATAARINPLISDISQKDTLATAFEFVLAQGAKHEDVIPLCPGHHRGRTGIPGLGTKGFAECYGFDEADLLADTKRRLQ